MNRLKLTSPGILLILATVMAGGIVLLDTFYLQPQVSEHKDAALRDRAVTVERAVRTALAGEARSLRGLAERLAQPCPSGASAEEPAQTAFHRAADAVLSASPVAMAWVSDGTGTVLASWTRKGGERTDAPLPLLNPASAARDGLIRMGDCNGLYVRMPLERPGALPEAHTLWLARPLDPELLGWIGEGIGAELTIVGGSSIPPAVRDQAAASQGRWVGSDGILVVAWMAADPGGAPLGYFRARAPVVQIEAQALFARRMVLIVLSLSLGLVVLIILGIHMLVTGPVYRLLRRLQKIDATDDHAPPDLTRDLHGEPLIIARRLECAFERLAHMSKTDQLTGLANRRHFEEVLSCFYHQSRRYNRPMSLIALDVDFFKAVNDSAGHQAGDQLLRRIAAAIEDACRKADLPARLGGDEFSVLLPETPAADAERVAERIRSAVSATPFRSRNFEMAISVSIGITDLNAGEIDGPEAMVAFADRALYAAKEAGRNRIVLAHNISTIQPSGSESRKLDTLCRKLEGLDSRYRDVFLQAVREVVEVLEHRDPNMATHARKVQHYAVLIAQEMELPQRVIQRIEVAAMLHDVGMLALPDSVLLCPENLEGEELQAMRRHPLLSVRIMERMEFFEQEIPAVRYHHERFDGKGYPEGISGARIPLTARILAVADTFDALTSSRIHRPALTRDQAVGEIQRGAGTQLDPSVVDAFLSVALRLGERMMVIPEEEMESDSRWRVPDPVETTPA